MPDLSPRQIPTIRVGILTGQTHVWITGTGHFQIAERESGALIGEAERGQVWAVNASDDRIEIIAPDGRFRGRYAGPVLARPAGRGGRIWVSGREYRGVVEVRMDLQGRMTVINELDMENYLRGVVPAEIGRLEEKQIDAARVQAVAARTYALSHRGRRGASGFDVMATEEDQVYRGFAIETRVTDRAIVETHGLVAVYKGEMIETYYSSTCGGHTESVHEGWLTRAVPYLRSVKDRGRGRGDFCGSSPWYRWTETWDRETLERILASALSMRTGQKIDTLELRDIRIRKRSKSGRVHLLEIRTDRGVTALQGDAIRSVLRRPAQGAPALRSTLFSLKIERDGHGRPRTVTARGGGYGHGIGLCQVGAIVMAGRGYRFDQILRHYYRGSRLLRAY
jgi:stage II sporulation protein D